MHCLSTSVEAIRETEYIKTSFKNPFSIRCSTNSIFVSSRFIKSSKITISRPNFGGGCLHSGSKFDRGPDTGEIPSVLRSDVSIFNPSDNECESKG